MKIKIVIREEVDSVLDGVNFWMDIRGMKPVTRKQIMNITNEDFHLIRRLCNSDLDNEKNYSDLMKTFVTVGFLEN